jgi:hypothetical protein
MTRNVSTLPRIGLSLTCWVLAIAAARADIEIENEALLVSWDADSARLSVQDKVSGREFLRDVRLSGDKGAAQLAPDDRGASGPRQVIEIEYADGGADRVILPARGPFVLFQARLANRTDAVAIVNATSTLSARIDLGIPGPRLKAFGTGGLLALDKNPGSYVWQAIVEPESRRGSVFGWLTHDRGSGALFTSVDGNATSDISMTHALDWRPGPTPSPSGIELHCRRNRSATARGTRARMAAPVMKNTSPSLPNSPRGS